MVKHDLSAYATFCMDLRVRSFATTNLNLPFGCLSDDFTHVL